MKKIYQEQWLLFKQMYWKWFLIMFGLFIAVAFISYFIMLKNEALTTGLMDQIAKMFDEKDLLGPDKTSFQLAVGLFVNNTIACFSLFVTGFLPIFLPAIGIIAMNSAIMGVLFAFMSFEGMPIFPMIMSGIVPHGIFEIPAIALAGALAFYISIGIYKKINNDAYSFKKCITDAFKTFGFVIVPLLVVAAIIEAYITPVIMAIVLGDMM